MIKLIGLRTMRSEGRLSKIRRVVDHDFTLVIAHHTSWTMIKLIDVMTMRSTKDSRVMDYDFALIIVHHIYQLNHSLEGDYGQVRHESQMNLCGSLISTVVGKPVLSYNLCVSQVTGEFVF